MGLFSNSSNDSNKNIDSNEQTVPDRAQGGLDDLDVPAYKSGDSNADLYDRAGRAAPQSVGPDSQNTSTTGSQTIQGQSFNGSVNNGDTAGKTGNVDDASNLGNAENATTAFGAQSNAYTAKPAAQDTNYADRDFAQPTQQFASTSPVNNQTQTIPTHETAAQSGAQAGAVGGAGVPATNYTDNTEYTDNRDAVDRRGVGDEDVYDKKAGRRGTIDFGLLFVRLALGVYLILAGASTFFGLGSNEGMSGLEGEFADYAMPQVLSIAVPTMQLIAGAFLVLGLVTPLAAAVGLVVTGFMAIHRLAQSEAALNIFDWPEAMWLSVILFVIAIALQFTGPGYISLDFNRSWARRPLATSWIFVIIAIAALVAIWWFGAAVNPLS